MNAEKHMAGPRVIPPAVFKKQFPVARGYERFGSESEPAGRRVDSRRRPLDFKIIADGGLIQGYLEGPEPKQGSIFLISESRPQSDPGKHFEGGRSVVEGRFDFEA
jgi:hypothetical protein